MTLSYRMGHRVPRRDGNDENTGDSVKPMKISKFLATYRSTVATSLILGIDREEKADYALVLKGEDSISRSPWNHSVSVRFVL